MTSLANRMADEFEYVADKLGPGFALTMLDTLAQWTKHESAYAKRCIHHCAARIELLEAYNHSQDPAKQRKQIELLRNALNKQISDYKTNELRSKK